MNKKHKLLYLLGVCVFLASSFSFAPIFAQTATLSVSLDTLNIFGEIIYGGSAPLTGVAMTSTVSGTATGTMNYYFYCNAPNDSSTEIVSGYAHSIIGTDSTTVTTPNGICDSVYANVGTYLAKVIVQRGGIAAEERRTVTVSSPLPAVDLKIRPLGTTEWSDWIIYLDYNTAAEIRWTFSGADYCTMSGDWSGTKTAPGQESTGNLTEAKTYIYTLECNTSSGMLTDTVMADVAPPTLFGSISANPNSGTAPLSGVILTANVTGGTAVGTINYTFYCNRSDTGTNITSDYAYKLDGTNLLTLSAPADACNSVYANAGTYTAKVIIERGGIAREYRTTVTVNPPPPPTVSLTADSLNLAYNTSTTLRWTVSNATTCTPSAGPNNWTSSGNKSIPTGTWSTGNLTGPTNYTYTLTCTGLGGTTSGSVTIAVGGPPPPPTVNIWANGSNGPITVPYGSIVNLSWETGYYGADRCEASGDWSGSKNPNGGQENTGNLFGPEQYIYAITCYDTANQSGWDQVVVNVLEQAPVIGSFQANPSTVDYGSASILSWESTRAVSCAITGGMNQMNLPADGSISTGNLTSTQSYTLTCSNGGGQDTRSLTVTVRAASAPTINSFEANPANIAYNTASQLSWSATSAISATCAITGGGLNRTGLPLEGSISTGNLTSTQTFTLTCTNSGGQATRQVTVTVGSAPAPTLDLQANRTSVDYGGSVTLTWSSTNATSCEAFSYSDKWTGMKLPNGTDTVYNLTFDDTFTLDCIGSGGTIRRSVNVNVGPVPRVTVNLSVKPAAESNYSNQNIEVDCGTAVDLRWESTGANQCEAWGDWSGLRPTSGTYRTRSLNEEGYWLYELWCWNDQNEDDDEVYVNVRECRGGAPIIFDNPLTQGDPRAILDSLGGLVRMIAIGLAAIMIIVSGIIIITSIDNRERLNKGKNMLKWALIGLAIALASSFIVGFIEELIV